MAATHALTDINILTENIVDLMHKEFENIQSPSEVSGWMDLARTSRQPFVLWEIDYIKPCELLAKANEFIRKSEIILYGDKKNVQLKDGYSADIYQEIAFHTIRLHLRSEEGDIQASLDILNVLLDEWYDKLSLIRQSNLLFHACYIFLCCGMFKQSLECFDKHWILLKYTDYIDRTKFGIWDNHIILQVMYWFFMTHCEDFRDFYSVQLNVSNPELLRHKKIPFMNFLGNDHSWLVGAISLTFYNHARTLFSSLPIWEQKRTTPTNYSSLWTTTMKNPDKFSCEEDRYAYLYNQQFPLHGHGDEDKKDNYLYSYYHFQTNYQKQVEIFQRLISYLNDVVGWDSYKKCLHMGCGLAMPQKEKSKKFTFVDISEYICKKARLKGSNVTAQCLSKFMKETDSDFDVCIVSDVLPNVSKPRLDIFIDNCAKKCKFLAASIDLNEDIRDDILDKTNPQNSINMHKTMMDCESWIKYLSNYFNIKYKQEDNWLYVIGNFSQK